MLIGEWGIELNWIKFYIIQIWFIFNASVLYLLRSVLNASQYEMFCQFNYIEWMRVQYVLPLLDIVFLGWNSESESNIIYYYILLCIRLSAIHGTEYLEYEILAVCVSVRLLSSIQYFLYCYFNWPDDEIGNVHYFLLLHQNFA